jgi:hypothetical protein
MDAPKRIVDDPAADSIARSLIEDARSETATPGAKGRTLAALGVIGATTVATTTSSALTALKALGVGVLTAGLLAGGALIATRGADPPTAPSIVTPSPLPPEASPPVEIAPPAVVSAPTASSSPRVAAKPRARAPDAKMAAAPSPSSSAPTTRLAEEAQNLEAARRELGARNAQSALVLLDRYERDFPRGELRPEATALRVEALAASGNEVAAKALGRQFLERNAGHPAAARVRRAIGDTNF